MASVFLCARAAGDSLLCDCVDFWSAWRELCFFGFVLVFSC